jgi:hypothetical protein
MLGESFGDLFQRWRKLRLSVLAAFLGHSAGGEKFPSTPQLFTGLTGSERMHTLTRF